ncbi:S41 family peptidase [Desulfolutivibrio sp.]|uniref:S41 family peptidase n=1 Tax=Desulfolutivibrio sp. TaxID=2773296 RepID=UPI002F96229C
MGQRLDHSLMSQAIAKIAVELRDGYVFPDKGIKAAAFIENALAAKIYDGLTDPAQFAQRVTADLQAVTDDSHMRVVSGSPFKNLPPPAADAGFEVKILAGNIGYIYLPKFVPPDEFKPAADDAMRRVSAARALIIDLQNNGGGHPASGAYLTGFFLDPNTPVNTDDIIWRNRGTKTFRTEKFWTSATPVSYLGRPVYVLVGPKTYSAGEAFAYDMQVLKRATVVGARTRGGAHPGGLAEIGPDLFVVVPTGRAENPATRTNWQGVGVLPDVKVAPASAQQTAVELAMQQIGTAMPK